jgi:hypothetical protein
MRKDPNKVDRKPLMGVKPNCYGYYSECSNCWSCILLTTCADMTGYLVKTNQDISDLS